MKALVGEHEIRNKEDQQIIAIKDMIMNPNYTGVKSIYRYMTNNMVIILLNLSDINNFSLLTYFDIQRYNLLATTLQYSS